MRILLCCHVAVDPRLGMGKHWIELAGSLRLLGWDVRVVGPEEIAGRPTRVTIDGFPAILRDFLRRESAHYDVIEYDHIYLPFPRSDFPPGPLFVARCMLLHHHFLTTSVPPPPGLRSWLRHTFGFKRGRLESIIAQTDATVRHADLTVVSNDRDAIALARNGANPDRIAILPPGLTSERLRQFSAISDRISEPPVVSFVGTFDPRKGMCEFPELVDRVARRVPRVTFKLLGTAGMVPDAAGVRGFFPRRLRARLEIHPHYDPGELPGLLSGVSVGVFPSRVEGFGYGVLEMLAAAVPVIAYDAPGPHLMLSPEYRVPIGEIGQMANRVCDLLTDPERLRTARVWARSRASAFDWKRIASDTSRAYSARIMSRAAPDERGGCRPLHENE